MPAAKVAVLVPIWTKRVNAPEVKRAAEPQQWTGLSSQLSNDYQHDDEHARTASPTVSSTATTVEPAVKLCLVEQTAPLPLLLLPLRLRPKIVKVGQAPEARPFGPKEWAGISAKLKEDFPPAASEHEEWPISAPRAEAFPVSAEQPPPTGPSTAATGSAEAQGIAMSVARGAPNTRPP